MTPPFGPDVKITAARERLDAINKAAEQYCVSLDARLDIVQSPDGGRHLKLITTSLPPESLYILIGECAYQMRSALDQLVVSIALANGGTGTKNYFPFAGSAAGYAEKATRDKLANLPNDAVALIDGLHPYKGGNQMLWGLSRLSVIDKHRGLVPFGTAGNLAQLYAGTIRIRNARGGLTIDGRPKNLHVGIELIDLGPDGEVDIQGDFHAEIRSTLVFGPDIDVFAGQPVVGTLDGLIELTASIVETLRAHCLGQQPRV